MSNTREVQAMQLPIQKLRPFENHPFQVKDDDEMNQLVWSVLTQGVLTPLVVRPLENDEYEVISGHRRLYACQKAGIEMVPALIYALDRDAAAVALVENENGFQIVLCRSVQTHSKLHQPFFEIIFYTNTLGQKKQVNIFFGKTY